jgi:hypothetical protein
MTSKDQVDRRKILQAIGGTVGVAGMAGCSGEGNGNSNGNENGNDNGNGNGDDSTPTEGDSEWPDLSGEEIHFVTDSASDDYRDLFGQVKEDFEAETGATLNIEYAQHGDAKQEILARQLQAGDPPEVFDGNSAEVADLYTQGLLNPVNNVIEALEATETFGELIDSARVLDKEGNNLVVNDGGTMGTHWYRTDIVDFVPETWDEQLEWAEEAHQSSETAYGFYVPTGEENCVNYFYQAYGWNNGARIAERNDSGEVEIVMDQGEYRDRWVETLEYLDQLHEFSPTASDATCSTMINTVPTQEAAACYYPGARPKQQSIERGHEWAPQLDPLPGNPEAPNDSIYPDISQNLSSGGFGGFVVLDGSNVEGGQTFLEYYYKSYGVEHFVQDIIHYTPGAWSNLPESEEYQSYLDDVDPAWEEDDIEQALDAVNHCIDAPNETRPPYPGGGSIHTANLLPRMGYQVLVEGKPAGQAVDDIAPQCREIIEESS